MAINKRISELNPLGQAASTDVFAIVDVSINETKKISRSDLMATPGPFGSGSASTGVFTVLTLDGTSINEFSTDGTFIGNSDTAVPTEKAVKTYVDIAVNNAVSLNIIHTSVDSTAIIGDVLLVDTTISNVTVELQPNGEGKIIVLKSYANIYKVVITTSSGDIYHVGVPESSLDLTFDGGSFEFLCDGVNFYVI